MKTLVANFTKQLTEAINIGENAKLSSSTNKIRNVLISGLGGSGIGGSLVSELTAMETTAPIAVAKGYFIPNYVNETTLFIASSYSGNTEETIQCLEAAMKKNAKIVCVTSGGKVAEIAKANNFDLIIIPGGNPPRACLAYSLTQLFYVLNYFGIINADFKNNFKNTIALLDSEAKNIQSEANAIAEKLMNKIPVIYTTTFYEAVGIRFRQQINENSKMLAWQNVIPEMNHNELVGWTEKNENLGVIILRDKDEYSRNVARIEINKEVISKYASVTEIFSKGNSVIEKALYFIHLTDWISCILADKRGVDVMEVKVIDHLKGALSKL